VETTLNGIGEILLKHYTLYICRIANCIYMLAVNMFFKSIQNFELQYVNSVGQIISPYFSNVLLTVFLSLINTKSEMQNHVLEFLKMVCNLERNSQLLQKRG